MANPETPPPVEKPDPKEGLKKSFELLVSPDAQTLMDAWRMTIKNNIVEAPGMTKLEFKGTKTLKVFLLNGNLVMEDTSVDGDKEVKLTYQGKNPTEFFDNTTYIGLKGYCETFPDDKNTPYYKKVIEEIRKKYPENPNFN